MNHKKTIAIIGGGPSALMLAACLDPSLYKVTIYEQNKALGRKFLVAGKGGFNLSHSEPMHHFIQRYTPPTFLKKTLLEFTNQDLRQWLEQNEIPTFIGSSKRIYPVKGIKPIEVLNQFLKVLEQQKVSITYNHRWIGWDNGGILFENKPRIVADFYVFALGGSSWKITGSDGSWSSHFSKRGISINPFIASNCAYQIAWPAGFLAKHEGKPIKNLQVNCNGQSQKGEAVITKFGLEGNAIYALSLQIQQQLDAQKEAIIYLDLKPTLSEETIFTKLYNRKGKSISHSLRNELKMTSVQIGLLKTFIDKEAFLNQEVLAQCIKKVPLTILSAAPLDEAISTSGGVALEEVDEHFQLHKIPNSFCIGEMLDWNAPTGGYLLQGCFSMGVYLSDFFNHRIKK